MSCRACHERGWQILDSARPLRFGTGNELRIWFENDRTASAGRGGRAPPVRPVRGSCIADRRRAGDPAAEHPASRRPGPVAGTAGVRRLRFDEHRTAMFVVLTPHLCDGEVAARSMDQPHAEPLFEQGDPAKAFALRMLEINRERLLST